MLVSNGIQARGDCELKPEFAFVFYSRGKNYFEAITKHKVLKDKTLGAGRCVSIKSVANMSGASKVDDFMVMPSHLLVSNSKCMVWVCKSKKRKMWFKIRKQFCLDVTYPNLIFIYNKNNKSLKIGAVGKSNNIDLDTKIYKAPLMNINDELSLCQGSAVLPRRYDNEFISKAEATLFESNFSHVNSRKVAKNIGSTESLLQYWKEKSKKKEKVKMSELHCVGRLKDVLKGMFE